MFTFAKTILVFAASVVLIQDEAPKPPMAGECLTNMTANDRAIRRSGSEGLATIRRSTSRHVVEALANHPPSDEFESPFHCLVYAAGEWRLEKTIGRLVPLIGFELDPATAPAGMRPNAIAFYPAAQALGRSAGRPVVDAVLDAFNKPHDETEARAVAWVLDQCLGREIATIVVSKKAEAANETTRTTAAAVKAILAAGEPYVRMPIRDS